MNRRYCAIIFPLLSADRWLREGGQGGIPLAFVEKAKGAMRIMALNEVALELGLAPGMMLADARARVPDLLTAPHDPVADAALLASIADDCDRYTPSVALDLPSGLILDITGCEHIWGGENELVSALAARLAHAGFTIRLALAETPDRARAMARHGEALLSASRRRPPGSVNEARMGYAGEGDSRLPIAALDLTLESGTALRRAGLYTVDDIAARPRTPFAARFGEGLTAKLARVLGEEDVRITPRRAVPALFILRRFAEPVAVSGFVLETIGAMAREAEAGLRARGQGGRRFEVSLYRSDGAVQRVGVETGRPARDPALIVRLFAERLDALADPLDPGFGYDAMRLDVPVTEALETTQSDFEGKDGGGEDLGALTDRLGARLGRERVRRFAPGNSHIPELAAFTHAASAPPFPATWEACAPGEPPARPLHLLDPPQLVEVIAEVPDGPPRRFRWRRRMHDIVLHEGPERIASEWWKRRDAHKPGQGGLTRDYFRVEDSAGRRFWLFRHGLYGAEKPNPDWYVHGVFA